MAEHIPLTAAAAPTDGYAYPSNSPKAFYKAETSYRPISPSDEPPEGAPPHGSLPARPLRRKRHFWVLEFSCLAVSLLAIAANVYLLRRFDGEPIPKWAWDKKGISLNSVLSLLSALSRGSLLVPLDEAMGQLMWLAFAERERSLDWVDVYNYAARGPGGALKMVWKRRGWGVECVGALVLIMSLGLGT